MKKLFLFAVLSALVIPVFAQQEDTDEYELRKNEKYGYIITQYDKKIDGIVKLMGTDKTPWVNQKKVKFIDKAAIDNTRKRQKFDKMDASDLKEYVAYEDDGTERHFKEIKYRNTREGLMNQSGSGLGGKLKTMKNLSTTHHMAEVIVGGRITMYRLYGYPAAVAVGKDDVQRAEADEQNIIDNPTLLVQKDDGKIEELHTSDIKDLVSDCKMVSDKLEAGQYKSYDPAKEEKKRSGFGKMLKHEKDMVGTGLLNIGLEVFTDYDTNCK